VRQERGVYLVPEDRKRHGLVLQMSVAENASLPSIGERARLGVVDRSGDQLGAATRSFSLVSGDTLAQTPPMGWNSYDSFGGGVTEAEVLAAAEAQKAQLQPYGWNDAHAAWYECAAHGARSLAAQGPAGAHDECECHGVLQGRGHDLTLAASGPA
jgi:hypothetical protein